MIDSKHLAGDVAEIDDESRWTPDMPRPLFGVEEYQKRIDELAGLSRGRSILKLEWATHVVRHRPHSILSVCEGNTLPLYLALWDSQGREVAAPRWVVMERDEQYEQTWEENRWQVVDGEMWDVKGPCPSERYTELWVHAYHDRDKTCCKRLGNSCWGYYAEPNEDLLGRIGRAAEGVKRDPDIKPYSSVRTFSAPQAQREVKSRMEDYEAKRSAMLVRILEDARLKRERNTSYPKDFGYRNGLYLPN